MSQNAELQVAIKANADQLKATILQVTNQLENLRKKIASIPDGGKELNKLVREYTRLSNTQQGLLRSFDRLGTQAEATAPKIEKTVDASKSARTALTSLSLVVQDLPFGFIGIQNNLPGIIQGFGSITATTQGKVLPALKLLGQTLIGPAGLFLAFSAVTSIVTELIQDYGSLGNAINSLLGLQKSLNSQIKEFNKEYDDFLKKQSTLTRVTQDAQAAQEGQLSVVDALVKRATNLAASQDDQKNAIEELSKVDKDFFGNLKFGVSTVQDIQKATEQYTKVLLAKSKVEAYKDEINSTQKLIEENKRLVKEQLKVIENDKQRSLQNQKSIGFNNEIISSVISQQLANKGNQKEIDNLIAKNEQLQSRVKSLRILIDEQTKVITTNTKTFVEAGKAVKQYFEAYKLPKEYLDFFKFFNDETKLKRGTQLFDDLNSLDLNAGANSVTKFNEILQQLKEDFPNIFEGISVSSAKDLPKAFNEVKIKLKEALNRLALQIVEDIKTSNINKAGGAVIDAFFGNTEQIREASDNLRKELRNKLVIPDYVYSESQGNFRDFIKYLFLKGNELKKLGPTLLGNITGGPGTYEKAFAPLIKTQEEVKKQTEKIVNTTRDAANLIGDVFFAPLQEQFNNLLTTGKFSLQEFGKAVLDNLKQLAAKILATGIVTLLATIFTGGFSSATLAATKLTGFQIFGKAFAGALGFGRSGAGPNFSAVGAGGLAMSGAVSLSLRGSDLVGAINRTNTNINRIG